MLALQGPPGVIGTPVLRGHAPAPRRSPQAGRWKELPAPEGPGGILWALKCEEPLCVERTREFKVCKKLGLELGALLTSQPAPPEREGAECRWKQRPAYPAP